MVSQTDTDDLVRQLVAALRTQSWNGADALERSWTVPASRAASAIEAGKTRAETARPPLPEPAVSASADPRLAAPRPVAAKPAAPTTPHPTPTAPTPTAALGLATGPDLRPEAALTALQATAATCQRCPRAASRRQVVFGAGDPRARLVIVGTAPDAASDAAGIPFAGLAGELLDKMLQAMHLRRADVWLTTLVLCRGTDDGPPEAEAVAACQGYLARQLDHIRPEALLLFGEPTARAILGSRGSIAELRGSWRTALEVPTIATYAPADMLRDPALKRFAWADLQQVMARLRLVKP